MFVCVGELEDLKKQSREQEQVSQIKCEEKDRQLEKTKHELSEIISEFQAYKTRAFTLLQQHQQSTTFSSASSEKVSELEAQVHRLKIENAELKRTVSEKDAKVKELEGLVKTSFEQHRLMENELQSCKRDKERAEESLVKIQREKEQLEQDFQESRFLTLQLIINI